MDKLIIFDVDGTLYKGHEVTVPATNLACDELKVDRFSEDYIRSLIGEPGYVLERIYGAAHERLLELTTSYELELMDNHGSLFDGAREALRVLADEGYTLMICSLAPREYLYKLLEKHGIWEYFTVTKFYSGGMNKTEMLGELLNETPHESAVMVGDRVFDIEAAQKNGIPCIGASYGYGGDEVLKADVVIDSLLKLPDAVRKI